MKKLVVLLFAVFSFVYAVPISPFSARAVAEQHISVYLSSLPDNDIDYTISTFEPINCPDGKALAHIANLSPTGFIAVSTDTRIDPVIAYSFDNHFSMENSPQNVGYQLIRHDMTLRRAAFSQTSAEVLAENQRQWELYLNGDDELFGIYSEMEVHGPLLNTRWGQGNPYNAYAPMDPETGRRSITGCVATAIVQHLNYCQWPNSIKYYDYDNYYSRYTEPPIYLEAEPASIEDINWREATTRPSWDTVARLMLAAGISVEMSYSSSASGAWVSAWNFLTDFGFGYAENVSSDHDEFYSRLASSIIADKPAMMSIFGEYGGHQINCDGYNSSTGRFHLNMGWEGSADGWYGLPTHMPSGFSVVNRVIINITKPRYRRHNVPSHDLPTLSDALEIAWPGDTIVVGDGRHDLGYTNLSFGALRIYIRSANGPLACTLDCRGSVESPAGAFVFQWGENRNAVLDGFTIINAFSDTVGAIRIYKSSPIIRNCIFINNSTRGGGGAIYAYHAYPRFENCIMIGNSAMLGGAMMLHLSKPEITNCNFIDNSALYGGSIFMENRSSPLILNSIFWNNFAEGYGDEIFINHRAGDAESWAFIGYSAIDVFANHIEHEAGGIAWDPGIISVDPMLTDDPLPFTPSPGSYCVNAGSRILGDTVMTFAWFDLYGNMRPSGISTIGGSPFDIGAVSSPHYTANRPPIIHGIPDIVYVRAGELLEVPFSAQDPDGHYVDVNIFSSTSARLEGYTSVVWRTTTGDIGGHEITLTANDGYDEVSKSFTVEVVDGYCGVVSGVWDVSGSPYQINCDVYVQRGSSLTIQPGVEVVFGGDFAIIVESGATLIAEGTETDTIVFRSASEDIAHHGIRFINASSDCILSYCRITGGGADGEQPRNRGGAIYAVDTDLTITNSLIDNNYSSLSGGAVYASKSNITLRDNRFANNQASVHGGAVYVENADPEIQDNYFDSNTANENGGAVFYRGGFGNISNNHFISNSADNGGAVFANLTTANFESNIFGMNEAIDGAGMYVDNCRGWVKYCRFEGNRCEGFGGGLFVVNCNRDIELHGLWFIDNYTGADGSGAGIAFAGPDELIVLTSSFFYQNTAEQTGGGVYATGMARPVLINCTVLDNEAGQGGGISLAGYAIATIFNTIVWDNNATESGGHEINIERTNGIAIASHSNIVRARCSEGVGVIIFNEGCIEADPLFEDRSQGFLGEGSSCINAGAQFVTIAESGEMLMAPFRDHTGSRRPREGVWDIGAHESEYSAVAELALPERLHISAFPNPFNSAVAIAVPVNTDHIAIYDIAGRTVHTAIIDNDQTLRWQPTPDIKSGIYIIEAKADDTTLGSVRVVYVR